MNKNYNSLKKALYQTDAIRKGNVKARNITITPMAVDLWNKSLRKKFQEDCPGVKMNLSLFFETILWQCKKIFANDKIKKLEE